MSALYYGKFKSKMTSIFCISFTFAALASFHTTFHEQCLIALTTKCVFVFPFHPSYVPTLPEISQIYYRIVDKLPIFAF